MEVVLANPLLRLLLDHLGAIRDTRQLLGELSDDFLTGDEK